jgi:predicted dehydrogenase
MKDRQTGVAIVGAGYWGPNLIRNFDGLPDSRVVWVCEKKAGRQQYVKEKFPGVPVTGDLGTVLSDAAVEAVVIATPVSTHRDLAIAALEAGKHVMIEKPMADTEGNAREIVEVAEQAKRVVAVDHLFVYNPAIAKMKVLVDEGQIAQLCYAESSRVNLGPPASEVDVIWDLATHDLSITYYLWGRLPTEVIAYGRRFLHPALIDVAFLHLRFDDDSLAVHHVSWLSPEKVRRYFLAGKEGSFVFDDTVAEGRLRQIDQGEDSRIGLKDDEVKDLFYRPGVVRNPEVEPVEPLAASCGEFIRCVRTGEIPRADGHAGLAVVRMLAAAERSLAEGSRPVRLD